MKDLKEYINEGIKPPRLSAKNRELWKGATEAAIMNWLKENCWIKGKVEIVNGKINVKGDIYIVNKSIEYFPYPFGEVSGYFDCSYCRKLTSLKNCSEKVEGYFSCSNCLSLRSLEGAPKEVGGDFYCYSCDRIFSLGEIRSICNIQGQVENHG